MRVFESRAVYDFDKKQWNEVYFINGKEIDFETYCNEQELETESMDGCDGNCENCEFGKDEENIDNVINDYVEMIQETGGCPDCIKGILENFFDEISEKFEE